MVIGRKSIVAIARTALLATCALSAHFASALEGGQAATRGHFGVVGAFAPNRASLGLGFAGVQIAPKWVLTAAHVAPGAGAIFVNDCGMSGVAEVLTFAFKVPTQTPLTGALRDDLALVKLAAPIVCPYYPRLADESAMAREGPPFAFVHDKNPATLVSNQKSIASRRFAGAQVEGIYRAPGFDFLLVAGQGVALVSGDSGSPVFLGRLDDTDHASVLAGVASGQTKTNTGISLGVYTRVGRYRPMLDAAVQASGEQLHWVSASDEAWRHSQKRDTSGAQ
jgi:hypothetical protein